MYCRTAGEACTSRTAATIAETVAASVTGCEVLERRHPAVQVEHVELGAGRRVADRDAGHEAVALGLGERVGALHLDRVLGRHDHERARQRVGRAVDGDLGLLHRLEQRALGLGGGAVDLVADDDVGEDGPRAELEVAHVLVEHRDAGDVARQQVGGELHAPHRAVDGPGQRLGEQGLADPRDVLDEEVPLGEQHGDRGAHDRLLALDDRVHRRGERRRHLEHLVERRTAQSVPRDRSPGRSGGPC